MALFAGLLGAGCDDALSDAGPAAVVRDSAGVEIVDNQRYAWNDGEGWRLADTARVEIGVGEGGAAQQLFGVIGAARLSDGRIAVANSGTFEVRYFDESGTYLGAVGREGEGPGEFRNLQSLWPIGSDSLLVWDDRMRRLSVITPHATVARVMPIPTAPLNPRMLRPLDDGSMILRDETLDPPTPELREQYLHLTRFSAEGEFIDSVGAFPGIAVMLLSAGGTSFFATPHFYAATRYAAAGHHFFIGEATVPEVKMMTADGQVARIIRWPDTDREVTQEAIESYRAERLSWITDEERRPQQEAILAATPFEDSFPAYAEIVSDRRGGLWVQPYRRPGVQGPHRWIVFDAAGRALGEVAISETLRVLDIGDDYILGVQRDELGIERVRLYEIVKP